MVASSQAIENRLRAIEEDWTLIQQDATNPLLEWCDNRCAGNWTHFAGKFYFQIESDAIMFALTHCKELL